MCTEPDFEILAANIDLRVLLYILGLKAVDLTGVFCLNFSLRFAKTYIMTNIHIGYTYFINIEEFN